MTIQDYIYILSYVAMIVMIIWFVISIITMTKKYKKEMRNLDLEMKRAFRHSRKIHKLEIKIIQEEMKKMLEKSTP